MLHHRNVHQIKSTSHNQPPRLCLSYECIFFSIQALVIYLFIYFYFTLVRAHWIPLEAHLASLSYFSELLWKRSTVMPLAMTVLSPNFWFYIYRFFVQIYLETWCIVCLLLLSSIIPLTDTQDYQSEPD